MRKLATLQTIKALLPIEGKDRIVLAEFVSIGWKCIVDKAYSIGERVVYVEPDSILPEKPEFEFLRSRCWNSLYGGFRIKSMKMGNYYSEGICFHADALVPLYLTKEDGYDLTTFLNVNKYDPEALEESKMLENKKKISPLKRFLCKIPLFRRIFFPPKKKGSWPSFISKTDETRIQILPYVLDKYKNLAIHITEKLDGQSATFFYHHREFGVCSRNMRLTQGMKNKGDYSAMQSRYWMTAAKYDLEKKLKQIKKDMGMDMYIQGEQCGPGIQGNKYDFDSLQFFMFNAYDITHKRYLSIDELKTLSKTYDIPIVPFLTYATLNWENMDALIEYAKGYSVFGKKVLREGIVIRSQKVMPPDIGMANMWSFKVINPDFSVKWGTNDFSEKKA